MGIPRGNNLSLQPLKVKPQPSPIPQPGAAVQTNKRLATTATTGAIKAPKAVKPAPHLKPFGGQKDPPKPKYISVSPKVARFIDPHQVAVRHMLKQLAYPPWQS